MVKRRSLRPKPRLPSKECKGCSTWFVPERKNQVFHNAECREAYYMEHYYRKVHVRKTCPECGTMFTTTCPNKQVYCKPECRIAEADRRKKERSQGAFLKTKEEYLRLRYAVLEKDGFKCVLCGHGKGEHVVLYAVNDQELGLVTLCSACEFVRRGTVVGSIGTNS